MGSIKAFQLMLELHATQQQELQALRVSKDELRVSKDELRVSKDKLLGIIEGIQALVTDFEKELGRMGRERVDDLS